MAAVLEFLPIPRAPASCTSLSRPTVFTSLSGRRNSSLLEPKGLRINARFRNLALASAPSQRKRNVNLARRAIVSESQDTSVDVVPAVTEATWQSLVIESDLPTLVEFWAPWCGPCRMIHPMIDELSRLYASKLKCLKLNTDESPTIATQYGIRSIPTVIIFKNGISGKQRDMATIRRFLEILVKILHPSRAVKAALTKMLRWQHQNRHQKVNVSCCRKWVPPWWLGCRPPHQTVKACLCQLLSEVGPALVTWMPATSPNAFMPSPLVRIVGFFL